MSQELYRDEGAELSESEVLAMQHILTEGFHRRRLDARMFLVIDSYSDNVQVSLREESFFPIAMISQDEEFAYPLDLSEKGKFIIPPDDILSYVADEFGVSTAELRDFDRSKHFAVPRRVAMYLMRDLTSLSYPRIAHYFHRRDHTSAISAIDTIKNSLEDEENIELKDRVERTRIRILTPDARSGQNKLMSTFRPQALIALGKNGLVGCPLVKVEQTGPFEGQFALDLQNPFSSKLIYKYFAQNAYEIVTN